MSSLCDDGESSKSSLVGSKFSRLSFSLSLHEEERSIFIISILIPHNDIHSGIMQRKQYGPAAVNPARAH